MKALLIGLAMALVVTAWDTPACAQKAYALLVGNADYNGDGTPNSIQNGELITPCADVELLKGALQARDVQVTPICDSDRDGMRRAFAAFRATVTNLPTNVPVIVYFSGHGVQVNGFPYIMPIKYARAAGPDPVTTGSNAYYDAVSINLTLLFSDLNQSKRLVFILVDACRTNPFDYTTAQPVALAGLKTPINAIIEYSTSASAEASDGIGNSPYVKLLVRNLGFGGSFLVVLQKTAYDLSVMSENDPCHSDRRLKCPQDPEIWPGARAIYGWPMPCFSGCPAPAAMLATASPSAPGRLALAPPPPRVAAAPPPVAAAPPTMTEAAIAPPEAPRAPIGTRVAVFWCSGPGGTARRERAQALVTQFQNQVDGRLGRGGAWLKEIEGPRELTVSRNQESGYKIHLDIIRYDGDERDQANAILRTSAGSGLLLSRGVQGTKNYVTVFMCA